MSARIIVLLTVLLAAALAGCVDRHDAALWVDAARQAHAEADDALAKNDVPRAVGTLEAFLAREAPRALAREDADVMRQDALFRLAFLALMAERPDEALRYADEGLGLSHGTTLTEANLYVARGQALEAQGEAAAAARAYHEALVRNEEMLEDVLAGKERPQ